MLKKWCGALDSAVVPFAIDVSLALRTLVVIDEVPEVRAHAQVVEVVAFVVDSPMKVCCSQYIYASFALTRLPVGPCLVA